MTLRHAGLERLGPNRWRIRAQARDPKSGGKISRMETIEGSQREALARLAALRADLRKSGKRAERVRLADYATEWLLSRAKKLKPGVRDKYANNIELHIIPMIGDLFVDAITPDDIRKFIAGRTAAGLAGNTVLNMLRLLRTIARDAQAEGLTATYFCNRVEPPAVEGYTDENPNMLNADQLGELLAAIPLRWLAMTLLLAYTGMRWSEMTGLRWDDLDIAMGTIKIRRGNYRGVEVRTKTAGSRRVVPLPRRVLELLGEPKGPRAFVFPVTKGKRKGQAQKAVPLIKVLTKACVAANVPRVTPHGLRRTFNDLGRQVADKLVMMSIVGHTTEAMHAHYSRVGIGEKAAVQDAVRLLVEGSSDAVTPTCSGCGVGVVEAWRWCPACGTKLVADAEIVEQ